MRVQLRKAPPIAIPDGHDTGDEVRLLLVGRIENFFLPTNRRNARPGQIQHLQDMTRAAVNVLRVEVSPRCPHCGESV